MAKDAQEELNEKIYRNLGLFVVAFSGTLHALESSTVHLIKTGGDGGPEPFPGSVRSVLIEAAIADRTASPIIASFFSVFFTRWKNHLTKDDVAILKNLRKELNGLVEKRNRLMHDAWLTSTVGGDPSPQPMSLSRIRAHGTGVEYCHEKYGPEEIERLAADASRLSRVIWATTWYWRDNQAGPELHPRIITRDGVTMVNPDPL